MTLGAGRFQLRNVTVTRYTDGKPRETVFAPTAEGSEGNATWTFWGMEAYGRDEQGQTYTLGGKRFDGKQETLATPAILQMASRPDEELTTQQLQEKAQTLHEAGNKKDARDAEVEIARRIMVPLGSFIFALVGAPLGITPNRASKGVGFGYSVLISFVYWDCASIYLYARTNGTLPPMLAVSLPNIAGVILGIYLIWRIRR